MTYDRLGRLLEASLTLDCDVFKLVEIFNKIEREGVTAENQQELFKVGFPTDKDPASFLEKITNEEPEIIIGYVNSFGYQHKKSKDKLFDVLKFNN